MVNLIRKINTVEGEDIVNVYETGGGYLVRENRQDAPPLMVVLKSDIDVLKYLLKLEKKQKDRLRKGE